MATYSTLVGAVSPDTADYALQITNNASRDVCE